MTSVSSSMTMGRQMMDARISRAAAGGAITATDQTALKAALDNIDSTLSTTSKSSAVKGGDMKTKMDSLIQQQVSAGTLTSDQASELQAFFQQGPGGPPPGGGTADAATGSDSSVGATEATGSVRGAHGRHGHPPSSQDGGSDDAGDATTTSSTQSSQMKALMSFLEAMRGNASGGTYGGTGSGSGSSGDTGLVFSATA